VNMKTLRQRCERLLSEVEVPEPFDVHTFADAISRRRGRPLRLLAKSSPLGPCGMWLALAGEDYVFYEAATSRLHREHIIVHELAHLLAAHEPAESLDPALLGGLLPDLDPAMIRQVLARTTYSAVEEQEAEMIASLVLARAGSGAAPSAPSRQPGTSADAGVVHRLNSTLGGAGTEHRGR
jgi:hypothetical protein